MRCNVRRILLAAPFVPVAGQEKLVAAIAARRARCSARRSRRAGVPLYTDARHYSAAGIPTVLYGAGPRTLDEANGHRADEKLGSTTCTRRPRSWRSPVPTCWPHVERGPAVSVAVAARAR